MVDKIRAPTPDDIMDPAGADSETKVDRRRPGRSNYIDKNLIALLRRSESSDVASSLISEADVEEIAGGYDSARDWEQEDYSDDQAPGRGLALALLIVTPFWAGIATLCLWFFRR